MLTRLCAGQTGVQTWRFVLQKMRGSFILKFAFKSNITTRKHFFISLSFVLCAHISCAQTVLDCSGRDQHSIYYLSTGNGIYRIDSTDRS